jgi:GNAT superfamily N-acetyltransferase
LNPRHGLEIRSVQTSDAPWLTELLAGAGRFVAAPELARRIEAVRASAGVALMASDWGPPIGLIVLHWSPDLFAAQPVARVNTLLVAPEARRRGVGRALLKAGSQAARSAGCGELHLMAADGDGDLLAFALGAGFAPVGAILRRALRKGNAG